MVTPVLIVVPIHNSHEGEVGFDTMQIDLSDLKIIFQRALNTWSDVPPYILDVSDKLQDL